MQVFNGRKMLTLCFLIVQGTVGVVKNEKRAVETPAPVV